MGCVEISVDNSEGRAVGELSATTSTESSSEKTGSVDAPSENYSVQPVFTNPWPTEGFTREDLVSTALAKTFPFFDLQAENHHANRLILEIDPMIPEENDEWISLLARGTFLTWSQDLPQGVTLVVGMSNQFLRETVAENKLTMPETSPGKPCNYDYGACTSIDTVWVGWGSRPPDSLREAPGEARMLAHKGFHYVQDSIDVNAAGQTPPRDFPNFRPVWFVEGAAEFYGYAMNDYLDLHPYGAYKPRIPFKSLSSLEEWQGLWDESTAYFWGQVAIEYLVANTGFSGYEKIYRSLERGSSFEEAFLDGAGISLDEFYDKFDRWALSYSTR